MDRRVFLLALSLIIGPLFMIIPDFSHGGKYYDFFLLSDQTLTIQTWAYFLCQHVVLLLLSYLIASEVRASSLQKIAAVYFWIQVADTVDYLLTYNSVWARIGNVPLSMNTLGIIVFVFVCLRYGGADR